MAFKILNGFVDLNASDLFLFPLCNSTRAANTAKLRIKNCHLDVAKYSFTHRVTNLWNSLPVRITHIRDLRKFKLELRKLDKSIFNCGYI